MAQAKASLAVEVCIPTRCHRYDRFEGIPQPRCTVDDELKAQAEQVLQYQFRDPRLLAEALTHASIADHRLRSNERMEFLGDAVLDLVICESLFLTYPEYLEGELTKVKSAVVSRKTCADVARDAGLADLLIIGKGISSREQMPPSLAAAVYESLVAAIYLDGGLDAVMPFIHRTMLPKVREVVADVHHQNYKALLQQHVQKVMACTPTYEMLDEKGPDHAKCFEVCVNLDGRRFPSAWGPNKKSAEQKAAQLALCHLGVLADDDASKAAMDWPVDVSADRDVI